MRGRLVRCDVLVQGHNVDSKQYVLEQAEHICPHAFRKISLAYSLLGGEPQKAWLSLGIKTAIFLFFFRLIDSS